MTFRLATVVTVDDPMLIPGIEGVEGLEKIGSGSTSTVYRARESSGRSVAVKVLHVRLDDKSFARFRKETEALRRVKAPYIEIVHRSGRTEAGQPWLIVEHLPDDLVGMVARFGPVTWQEAVAAGALDLAVARMAAAIRMISIQRGHDIAEAVLVSYGGAGGQHACALAEQLGVALEQRRELPAALRAFVKRTGRAEGFLPLVAPNVVLIAP